MDLATSGSLHSLHNYSQGHSWFLPHTWPAERGDRDGEWRGEWGRGRGEWGRGRGEDVGTWGRGDVGTWGRTWGRGDVGTWGRGDV
jgi:hypothetical protein